MKNVRLMVKVRLSRNEKCQNNGKGEINYVVKLGTTLCERFMILQILVPSKSSKSLLSTRGAQGPGQPALGPAWM